MPTKQCECSDPGCPAHKFHRVDNGTMRRCQERGTTKVRRIDMEDGRTTFVMCADCAADALASGVFA